MEFCHETQLPTRSPDHRRLPWSRFISCPRNWPTRLRRRHPLSQWCRSGPPTCQRNQALGTYALCAQGDLSNPSQVTRLFKQINRRFGHLDLVINNTGTYRPTPLLRTRHEDWFAGLHSTATATFLTTQSAIPLFPKSGGRIINLGDSASDRVTPRKLAPGYHVGKIGVSLLTRSFATQLISRKITVNQISPGYLENSIDLPPHHKLPSGRPVSFSEVFSAVRYFLSPDASQVTGNNLIISGGWNL